MSTAIDVVPDDPRSLCLVRTRSGRRIIITLSFFMAFGEKVPMEVRFRSVAAYITCLDYMEASGNQSLEKVEQQRAILDSFVMGLEFGQQLCAILGSFLMGLEFGRQSSTTCSDTLPVSSSDSPSSSNSNNNNDVVSDVDRELLEDCSFDAEDEFDLFEDYPYSDDGNDDDLDEDYPYSDDANDDDLQEDYPYSNDETNDDDSHDNKADASSGNEALTARQFRKPRILALASGYFKGPRSKVITVSKPLGIGYGEMLFIRVELGENKFNQLLIAHDLLDRGRQASSPLELTFACPGVPECPGYKQLPCACGDRDEVTPQIMMVGGGPLPFHPRFGLWLCQLCYRKIRVRELAMLKELETTGQITSEQQARLRVLQERLQHKQMFNRARRELPAVQCQERAATRRHARRQIELIEDGVAVLYRHGTRVLYSNPTQVRTSFDPTSRR